MHTINLTSKNRYWTKDQCASAARAAGARSFIPTSMAPWRQK
jgi:hypothetical protein